MDFWKQLINTALLGTDRQSLPATQLPAVIQQALQGVDTSDKEALFLRTAALVNSYIKAGTGAQTLLIPATPPSQPETQSYASVKAVSVWRKIAKAERRNPVLMEYWMDQCISKGQIAPPDILPSLLNAGAEKTNYALRDKIRQVVGKRGTWLASFTHIWSYCLPVDYEMGWKEGSIAQRKEIFEKIRRENPDQAREWLEQAWPDENAKDRKDFLQSFSVNLSLSDEPFLQKAWEEVLAQPNPKAVHQEIKIMLTTLLLSLPDSALSKDIWEKTKGYFQQKGSTGKVKAADISLRLAEDDFLTEAFMNGKLGFEPPMSNRLPNAEKKPVSPHFWFQSLLPHIHPARWQEYFGLSVEQTVQVFIGKLQDDETDVALKRAFARSVVKHKLTDWATKLLPVYGDSDHVTLSLVSLLPQADIEAWYQQRVDIGQANDARLVLLQPHLRYWSLPFTRHVLAQLYKSLGNWSYTQSHQQFLSDAVLHVPHDIIPELETMAVDDAHEWQKQQWRERIVFPLTQMLEYRQEIEAAFP
jgi:hypothetical protein